MNSKSLRTKSAKCCAQQTGVHEIGGGSTACHLSILPQYRVDTYRHKKTSVSREAVSCDTAELPGLVYSSCGCTSLRIVTETWPAHNTKPSRSLNLTSPCMNSDGSPIAVLGRKPGPENSTSWRFMRNSPIRVLGIRINSPAILVG